MEYTSTVRYVFVNFFLPGFVAISVDAVSRAVLVSDVYRDFDIPAGTVVVANLWLAYRVHRLTTY